MIYGQIGILMRMNIYILHFETIPCCDIGDNGPWDIRNDQDTADIFIPFQIFTGLFLFLIFFSLFSILNCETELN